MYVVYITAYDALQLSVAPNNYAPVTQRQVYNNVQTTDAAPPAAPYNNPQTAAPPAAPYNTPQTVAPYNNPQTAAPPAAPYNNPQTFAPPAAPYNTPQTAAPPATPYKPPSSPPVYNPPIVTVTTTPAPYTAPSFVQPRIVDYPPVV